eukprot:1793390-Amphidinium_carterae.1
MELSSGEEVKMSRLLHCSQQISSTSLEFWLAGSHGEQGENSSEESLKRDEFCQSSKGTLFSIRWREDGDRRTPRYVKPRAATR